MLGDMPLGAAPERGRTCANSGRQPAKLALHRAPRRAIPALRDAHSCSKLAIV
jgi:hypothetical protein